MAESMPCKHYRWDSEQVNYIMKTGLLLQQYSEQLNITQRRIVEVSLIEFFNKYGYNYEVKWILNG